ncbi:MAG: DUF58 domain-containing protein [Pyrinomonadaceae bacterium]
MRLKKLRQFSQLVTYKELRNGALGLSVVVGGLALAGLTLYAHLNNDVRFAGIAATASLFFVVLIVIFVIPPLARNASAEASQLNIPFEFTTGGAIFIGLLVIVGFAAWNTGNNLLFLVLSFVSGAMLVSFFAGHFGLKKLDVKMRFPETIFAEEPTPITVSLHSRKRIFPTFSVTTEVRGRRPVPDDLALRLSEFVPSNWAEKIARPPLIKHTLDYFMYLPRRGNLEYQVEHVFEKYGRFEIRDFELSTKFPFGLFRHRRRLPAQKADIVVFPAQTEFDPSILETPIDAGNAVSKKKGIGQDLLGLREYQPLDDLRHIDWKATARASRMIVRDFTAEDELRVVVVLDTRIVKSPQEAKESIRNHIERIQNGLPGGESAERIDEGVRTAANLLSDHFEKGAEVALFSRSGMTELTEGRRNFYESMRAIASSMPVFVDEYMRDGFDEEVEDRLGQIADCHVFLIRAADSDLPAPDSYHLRVIGF